MSSCAYIMDKFVFFALIFYLCLLSSSLCDIYMHNPRGSNNRQDENGRERKNANRLFDSQNNNRGGYNVGNLYFFSGSKLQIEWTSQHSCADANTKCDIILQYMCAENLRDGTGPKGTNTIPRSHLDCLGKNCTTDYTYGMHENHDYYQNCAKRERNKGLFVADQNLRRRPYATSTRQNPNGQRYGYECPEERDYYPYWQPTPWRDIAVLTDTPNRCPFYREQSANVKARWSCQGSAVKPPIPITAEGCAKAGGNWTRTPPHNLPAPECHEPQWTRDNHLGNTHSGYAPSFNWTLPSGVSSEAWCTLRIRYNISTSDYEGWSVNSTGIPPTTFAKKFGFSSSNSAEARGYVFKNNPKVNVFGDAGGKLQLQLAINTQQLGRVFQDRSHAFRIRPAEVSGTVHNINVRGKRGNIVQVYPAVEYDFTPNLAEVPVGDYVHFQWTGSNNNPQNNDGQGALGTDRNNLLLQAGPTFSEPAPSGRTGFGLWTRSYPQDFTGKNASHRFLSLSKSDVRNLAFSGSLDAREFLDSAATYFDLGPRKVTGAGTHHFVSSRNNDFSNRSQKGKLRVGNSVPAYIPVGSQPRAFQTDDKKLALSFASNSFSVLEMLRYQVVSRQEGEKLVKESPPGYDYASDFFFLGFNASKLQKPITVTIKVDSSKSVIALCGNSESMSLWQRLSIIESTSDSVTFLTSKDGVFVARKTNDMSTAVIAILVVLALLFIGCAIAGVVIYLKRNPDSYRHLRSMFSSQV